MIAKQIFLVAAVLVAAPSLYSACVGPEALESELRAHRHAKTLIELGTWFDRHQQYPCAVQSYRSALKLDPASPKIFELLGASLYSSGDLGASADALKQSIRLAPNNLSSRVQLATVLEQLQSQDEAKAQWQAALRIDSQSQAALDGLSQHLIAEGDYAGAIVLLRSAKLNERLTLDLAQAYGKAGMLREAEQLLRAALSNASSYPLVNALATVYVNQGLREKALETAENFSAAHPEDLNAQTLRLRLLLLINDTKQAAPLAQQLLASRPRDPYLLYVCGTLERQAGNFEAARDHLQLAVTLQPDVYQSHYGLGVVLLKLSDLHGAKQHFEKAISLGSPDPEVHLVLATVLRKLGDLEASERELKLGRDATQSKTDRSVAENKATLAEREMDSGNIQKAVELYREALELTPDDALLTFKLSVALDKLGDIAGEREALERAVRIDPDLAAAHNQLGYLASRSGDPVAAEQHFRQAVRAAPSFTQAWINLAATLGIEAKLLEAQKVVETALKLDPANEEALRLRQELTTSAQPSANLGLAYYKKGDYTKAQEQFEISHKLQPNDARIAILLADTDMHLNRAEEAVALLKPMAAANSQNLDFEYIYGSALIAIGQSREGVQHLERVAELRQSADAYMAAGEALLALEEFERARTDLEAALRLNASLPRVHTLVGIARDKNGDTTNAEAAFREALKINPDDFQANLYVGAILYQRRELNEAKQYLDRALKLNPRDSMARYESAILNSALGQYENAREELEQLVKSDPEWLEPHLALSMLYYKVHRPEDGVRERQIVERLTHEQQARSRSKY